LASHEPVALGKILEDNPVAVAALVFVSVSAMLVYWRKILPGGKSLEPKSGSGPSWKAFALVAFAACLALVVRAEVLGAYRVLSSSMQPTLASGDTLTVDRLAYRGATAPKRGDVIVFTKEGEAGGGELIKRVIGLPGDRVKISGGALSINGWEVPRCDVGIYSFVSADAQISARLHVEFLGAQAYLTLLGSFPGDLPDHYDVEAGTVFVLGDNRTNSMDSRVWAISGVPLASIRGQGNRLLSVAEREDKNSLRHLFEPLGTRLHVDDADPAGLQAGIEQCLKQRPQNTNPPPASPEPRAAR
jgi:signal peptidase I